MFDHLRAQAVKSNGFLVVMGMLLVISFASWRAIVNHALINLASVTLSKYVLSDACGRNNHTDKVLSGISIPRCLEAEDLDVARNYLRMSSAHSPGAERVAAISLLVEGKYVEAVKVLEMAQEKPQRDFLAYWWAGVAYEMLHRHKAAISAWRQVRWVKEWFLTRGVKAYIDGNLEDAIRAYEIAIDIDPTDAEPYYGLGKAFADQGRWMESIKALRTAVQLNPALLDAYLRLSQTYREMGQFQEAIQWAEKAAELDPGSGKPFIEIGQAYLTMGEISSAIMAFRRALIIDSGDVLSYVRLCESYMTIKEYDTAMVYCQEAVSRFPHASIAYETRGRIYFSRGQWEQAMQDFREAIDVNPSNASAHYWLGRTYAGRGRFEDAIANLRRATELQPKSSWYHYYLAESYRKAGLICEATVEYRLALEMDSTNREARDKLTELGGECQK